MLSKKIPKRGWIPLYLLSVLGRVPTATKLQKLVFLIQTEGKVDGGYLFHKKHYGPYSEDLDVDVKAFSNSLNLMETRLVEGASHQYYLYTPTDLGRNTTNQLLTTIPEAVKKRVNRVIQNHGEKTYHELLEYVYENYVINETTFDQLYHEISDDLFSLETIWKQWYKDDCPSTLFVLAMIDYQSGLLTKLKSIEEPVFRGVCLSSISELTAKLMTITSSCKSSNKCSLSYKQLFSEVSDQINFLSSYCCKHEIIGDFFDADFCDFLGEEELERLEKELAKTSPTELLY